MSRHRGKQTPQAELPEAEIMTRLHTGSGVRREGLEDNITAMGIERLKLAAAQRTCPSLARYYLVQLAWEQNRDARDSLTTLKRTNPELFEKRIDNIIEGAEKFELVNGVLFRRVYDAVAAEVQLRCAIPDLPIGMFEAPGLGQRRLNYRDAPRGLSQWTACWTRWSRQNSRDIGTGLLVAENGRRCS